MRTKDELFRAAQREVAAYRQQAVMQAETARRAAYAAHPALAEADSAHLRAGLGLAKAAALGGNMDTARAALTRADEALAAAVREAGSVRTISSPPTAARCVRIPVCAAVSPAAAWQTPPAVCAGTRSCRQPARPVPVCQL